MLTRITKWEIPCVYIHVYQITKNWGPGPYNSLRPADNRRYFSGLSLTRNQREAHVLLGQGSGKIWTCSCWEKGNFVIINEFKYVQTWKIWSSPLSLSLYNPFNMIFLNPVKVSICRSIKISVTLSFLDPDRGWRDGALTWNGCKIPENKQFLKISFNVFKEI